MQGSLELFMRDVTITTEKREDVWHQVSASIEVLVEDRGEAVLCFNTDLDGDRGQNTCARKKKEERKNKEQRREGQPTDVLQVGGFIA